MHGIMYGTETSSEELSRLSSLSELGRRALECKVEADLSDEAEALVRKVVESNPDDYTLWNYRREWLLSLKGEAHDRLVKVWNDELRLTEKALLRHPKAYATWQHRVWLLAEAKDMEIDLATRTGLFEKELALCSKMLKMDARNFHAWAHWERVSKIAGKHEPARVVEYTEQQINADFSNYSAWHYRSVNLAEGIPIQDKTALDQLLDEEVDRLRQAFYTDPDSQSAWFYYRWLLNGAPYYSEGKTSALFNIKDEFLKNELKACQELIDLEPFSKWALLTKVYLLRRLGREAEAEDTIVKLTEIDPMRLGYYRNLASTSTRAV
ncbi:hypothetical protein NDN08_007201 [Rhodosorus marinus]|uniref:Geranylgeranyl transferase type-2 subunit alpha n=1 Tax=Rhodosorus marinus TaxID=101924 RepID=A0AAV8UFU3_9RHOD|nr:hypothetical protein NDN08_007201 [Rhodosorus marinus]